MTPRECVTHLLGNFHESECGERDLWRCVEAYIATAARTNARCLSSHADYRVALAVQRRERRESARRGVCERIDYRNCEPRGGVCTPYPQPTPRAVGALET